MNRIQALVNSTLAGVIALANGGCSDFVAASKKEEAFSMGHTETCYGIARAGENDCKTATTVCAGWARQDRDPTAYVYLPAGTCEKIVGGSLKPKS